jgi:hypothetical protein
VRAQEILGAVAARTGSLTDARYILTAAAEEAAAFDPAAAVALLSDAVNACFYLGDSGWAMAVIDRSAAVLAAAGTARARILGLMAVGTAELLAGRGEWNRSAGRCRCCPPPTNCATTRDGWRCWCLPRCSCANREPAES